MGQPRILVGNALGGPLGGALPPVPQRDGRVVGEKVCMKREDYGKIVEWLEILENFAQLHGTNRKKINDKYPSKKTVFMSMLVMLHAHGFPQAIATGYNLSKRLARYVKRYREALEFNMGFGQGLTDAEARSGMTLAEKLEKLCPYFPRMHILFGERANVNPPMLGTIGLHNGPEVYHKQDDDEYNLEAESYDNKGPEEEEDKSNDEDFSTQQNGAVISHTDFNGEPSINIYSTQNYATEDDPEAWMADICASGVDLNPHLQPPAANTPTPPPTAVSSAFPTPSHDDGKGDRKKPIDPAFVTPARPAAHNPRCSEGDGALRAATQSKKQKKTRGPRRPAPLPAATALKPNMAQIYVEKLGDKVEYRAALMEKDKWKSDKLEERREAREQDLLNQRSARAELAKLSERKERAQWAHNKKRACLEREHQLSVVKHERRCAFLEELIKAGKSELEMKSILNIYDHIGPPTSP